MGAHSSYRIINEPGLVIHLDSSNKSSYPGSGTTWYDISGNNNNATLVNGPSYNASNKGIFVFDGIDDYATIPSISYDRNKFSVFTWFNFTSYHIGWKSGSFSKWKIGGSDGSGNEWFIGVDGVSGPSKITASVHGPGDGNNWTNVVTNFNYVIGTWYHVGITFNNGTLKFYVNGVLIDTKITPFSSVRDTTQDFRLANFYTGSQYVSSCKVPIAKLFSSIELSEQEILYNYNTTRDRFGISSYSSFSPNITKNGLSLYLDAANKKSYPGSGNIWYDLSGKGNNATLVNSPTFGSDYGGNIRFDGINNYITMNSNASITSTTPTLIVTCTVASGTVLAKGGYGSYWNYGLTSLSGNTYRARNNNGDTLSPTFASTSRIYSVYAVVWNGTQMLFYKDGVYGGSSSTFYSPNASNSLFFRIGCAWHNSGSSNTEFYSGKISSIIVYNRILTADEILQNFLITKSRFDL